jgi:hypothetical protein
VKFLQQEETMSESRKKPESKAEDDKSVRSCDTCAIDNKSRAKGRTIRKEEAQDNRIVRLLEKNPLGMTLAEMAGGAGQLKKIKTLRPLLAEALRLGIIMPVSKRGGACVYRLVKKSPNG